LESAETKELCADEVEPAMAGLLDALAVAARAAEMTTFGWRLTVSPITLKKDQHSERNEAKRGNGE